MIPLIDFHSHILPKMDDGSRSVEESVAMLNMLSEQNVSKIAATPHFNARQETVETFLQRRLDSYGKLKELIPSGCPDISLGAEVAYYEGISALKSLEDLCIGNGRLLLLEMPVSKWSEFAIRELIEISCSNNVKLVLAHIERSMSFQHRDTMERLLENDILMQSNAGYFSGFLTKHKACKMLKNGRIHLIGSDCHNTTVRSPQIGRAYVTIEKLLGTEFLDRYSHYVEKHFVI